MSLPLPERYRPKSLDKVIGQKQAMRSINAALSRKATPKTWLFTGPSGTGKTTLAEILANIFAGGNAGPANVLYVNAAVDTGAEETRNTVNKAFYKALAVSPVKTHIVDECHNLSGKAWDSLLVATERPPEHVYWIFCSTNPGKIPETIKTRCFKVPLKPVGDTEIFDLLADVSDKEGLNALPEVMEIIATECNGSPREALSNLEKCAHVKSVGEVRDLLRLVASRKTVRELGQMLLDKQRKPAWTEAMKLVTSFENAESEGVRIELVNYIAGAAIKATSNNEARRILGIQECFSTPYTASDKLAPLLMSIGMAIGLDNAS